MKTILVVGSIALLTSVLTSGCATQADLQAQTRENDLLRSQLADSRASNDTMKREIEKMRGDMDVLRDRVERATKARTATSTAATTQIRGLEDRIAGLERQLAAAHRENAALMPRPSTPLPAPSTSPSSPPNGTTSPTSPTGTEGQIAAVPSPPPPPPPPTILSLPIEDEILLAKEPAEAQEDYRVAWQSLNGQQYDKAIQQFRTFQRKNPASELADDAQYWIGESYFTRRDYNRAILEYNDVLKYRKGDKVPAALLRQSQAFVEIGDKTDARLILQKLINDYPNSRQAKDAREKLQNLGR